MTDQKILIPLYEDQVAPRFDLALEVYHALITKDGRAKEERTVVLPSVSAERLCHHILAEKIRTVICGAIADQYYQYLKWKKVNVVDSVIGYRKEVVNQFASGNLQAGAVLINNKD